MSSTLTVPIGGKVFIVNRFFYPDESATAKIAADLAFHLARQNIDVVAVACRAGYFDGGVELPAAETVAGVTIRRVATTNFGRYRLVGKLIDFLSFYVSVSVFLVGALRRGDILICKTDPPMISVPAGIVAYLRGAVLINWLQDVYPEIAEMLGIKLPRPVATVLRKLRNRSIRAARANVVIGTQMRDRLIANGASDDRVHVIPNWSADAIQPLASTHNPLRAEWGYQPEHLVLGYSGNLGRAHDYQLVIEAARALRDHPHVRFLLVGDGAGFRDFQVQAAKFGLTNVNFQGYQPSDMLSHSLSVPDVHWLSLKPELEGLILPSKFYGIVAVERPYIFVGSTDGEMAELTRQFDAGFVVRPEDAKGLTALLEQLAQDRALCTRMGANGRAMKQVFSVNNSLAAWDRVLHTAKESGKDAPRPNDSQELVGSFERN